MAPQTPYPVPRDAGVSQRMSRNRRRDTRPELALRRVLHAHGLRYRVDAAIRVEGVQVKPDVVFAGRKVAVFIDGCFWHSCPEHGNIPTHNHAYWAPKLSRNVERDRRVDLALSVGGWTAVRIWEHEDTQHAAERVVEALQRP
jgi:DNA mismatch endonuclease (patch repair protein)